MARRGIYIPRYRLTVDKVENGPYLRLFQNSFYSSGSNLLFAISAALPQRQRFTQYIKNKTVQAIPFLSAYGESRNN